MVIIMIIIYLKDGERERARTSRLNTSNEGYVTTGERSTGERIMSDHDMKWLVHLNRSSGFKSQHSNAMTGAYTIASKVYVANMYIVCRCVSHYRIHRELYDAYHTGDAHIYTYVQVLVVIRESSSTWWVIKTNNIYVTVRKLARKSLDVAPGPGFSQA